MTEISFELRGIKPTPKGSARNWAAKNKEGKYTGKVARKDSSKLLKGYQDSLAYAARAQMTLYGVEKAIGVPVRVWVRFYLARPLVPTYAEPIGKPHGDTDKMCRAVGDALEAAGVLSDDAQIVGWDAEKHFGQDHLTLVKVRW